MENFPLVADFLRPIRVEHNVVRFEAPHLGSAVTTFRLFGGQTLAQIHAAVKLLYPEFHVLSMRECFLLSGNVITPLDYHIDRLSDAPFLNIGIYQAGKIIITVKVKLGTAGDVLTSTNYRIPKVKGPLFYPSLVEMIKNSEPKAKGIPLLKILAKWDLFYVRPLDFTQMQFASSEWKPFVAWCTLADRQKAKKLPKSSGKAVLALMSDFWSVQSCAENYDLYERNERRFPATLNHVLTFHATEELDPCGWYLAKTECNNHANNRFFARGQLFDVKGTCVLSFEQEGCRI